MQMVQRFSSENSYLFTKLHGVICHKAVILIFTVVRASNLYTNSLHYNTYLKVASSKKHSYTLFPFRILVLKADVPPTLYGTL